MSAALAILDDDMPKPRRVRHLYLVAVDGRIVDQASGQTSYKPDTIDTLLFTDGINRVLQTKKDATIDGKDVMIVSGRVTFDAFGRCPVRTVRNQFRNRRRRIFQLFSEYAISKSHLMCKFQMAFPNWQPEFPELSLLRRAFPGQPSNRPEHCHLFCCPACFYLRK